jgi:tetratricopeptide (TPR) repeat protein
MTETETGTRPGRSEWRMVVVLWVVLVAAAVAALAALNSNATRIINHIEYVKARRFVRAEALFLEAERRANALIRRAGAENTTATVRQVLPQTDPDFVAAVDLYKRAFALTPVDQYAPEMRRHYERMGRMYECVGADRDEVRAYARAFVTAGAAADLKNAESYASTLATRDPKDAESWRLLAEIRLRDGRVQEAESAVLRFEAAGGAPPDIHKLRGRIAQARGAKADAIREFEATLAKQPSDLQVRKTLAEIYDVDGKPAEALRVYEQGLAHGGTEDGNYMDRYGILLLKSGDATKAVGALEDAADLEPNSDSIQWSLAQAYLKAGMAARSRTAMQRATTLNPALLNKALDK